MRARRTHACNGQTIHVNDTIVYGDHNTIHGNGNQIIGNGNCVYGNDNTGLGENNGSYGERNEWHGAHNLSSDRGSAFFFREQDRVRELSVASNRVPSPMIDHIVQSFGRPAGKARAASRPEPELKPEPKPKPEPAFTEVPTKAVAEADALEDEKEESGPAALRAAGPECIICLSAAPRCVILPCGELKICAKCARKLCADGLAPKGSVPCPGCRTGIEAIKRTY